MARLAKGMPKVSVAAHLRTAGPAATSVAPDVKQTLAHATAALEAFRPMDNVARMARPVRDLPRASVVLPLGYCGKDTAFCGSGCQSSFGNCNSGFGTITTNGECGSKNGETCKGFAKGECCSASGYCGSSSDHCAAGCQNSFGYATPAPAPFPLMASAVARMVGFAKASLKGTVAVQTATVALHLTTAVRAARTALGYAMAVQTLSQLTETALKTENPAMALPTEAAAALPTIVASHPLIAALGGKLTLLRLMNDEARY
jgi:hypothetical protein